MEEGPLFTHKPTVEEIFDDIKGRYAGMRKALTIESEEFYRQCDPEKDDLCLYGLLDETWKVRGPPVEALLLHPDPTLGINGSRDGMLKKDWLVNVAAHSDCWLISLALFTGITHGFDAAERDRLFTMINELPTLREILLGIEPKKGSKQSSSSKHSSNKSKSSFKRRKVGKKSRGTPKDEGEAADHGVDEQNNEIQCGACKKVESLDDFWICCDRCDTWFHGLCVRVDEVSAKKIKKYKCRYC